MALHVAGGEFPVFLWGQAYKGVPEAYLAAAVFVVTGPTVVSLKAVTLAIFVAAVLASFTLVDAICGRRTAWTASCFLIACPPTFVHWTLSGSAEVAWTMLAGALVWLGWARWRSSGSARGLTLAAGAAGFGLWVHDYVIYYLVALCVVARADRSLRAAYRASKANPLARWVTTALGLAGGTYVVLGGLAFLGFGFSFVLGPVTVSVLHAQKLWRIAALALLAGGAVGAAAWPAATRDWRWPPWLAAAAAFGAGYAPAIAHRVLVGGGAPIAEANASDVAASLGPIVQTVVPMIFGFKGPDTGALPIALWAALPVAAALGLGVIAPPRGLSRIFVTFLLSTPALFLASGAYVDEQSYRYLMPLYAGLPVLYGFGAQRLGALSRVAGGGLLASLAALFIGQQVLWYQRLAPDSGSARLIECLDERRIDRAFADYWVSYKLTFLTRERLIVAPTSSDRYPAYTALVEADATAPLLTPALPGTPEPVPCDLLLQRPQPSRSERGLNP